MSQTKAVPEAGVDRKRRVQRPVESCDIRLAEHQDDQAIRSILCDTAMAGAISVSFRRDPNYFEASKVFGEYRQTAIAVPESSRHHIAALGARSARMRYVHGRPQEIGYLCDLRIAREHRRTGMIGRMLKFLLEQQDSRPIGNYLIAITEDNVPALKLVKMKMKIAPSFKDLGTYHTASLSLRRWRRKPRPERVGLRIRRADHGDLAAIVAFINEHGREKQFFPMYEKKDFFSSEGTFLDLNPEDIRLAYRGEELVGVMGGWDQHRYRQTVLNRYSKSYRRLRPFYNLIAPFIGMPKLPGIGRELSYLNAALPIVAGDDPVVFKMLLETVMHESRGKKWDFLVVGLHETHPLLEPLHEYKSIRYRSKIFMVHWDDQQAFADSLDESQRPTYLELGCM